MMSYKSIDTINDVLSEINYLIGLLDYYDSDSEMTRALRQTHSLAWDLVEVTKGNYNASCNTTNRT